MQTITILEKKITKFEQVYKSLDKSRTFSHKSRQVWTYLDKARQLHTSLNHFRKWRLFYSNFEIEKKIWWLKLTFADELEFVLGGTRGGSDSFSKSCPDCTEKNRGKN